MQRGATLTLDELNTVRRTADASKFVDAVSSGNASILHDHLMYYNVIDKRSRQLDAIKEGFKCAGIFNFLANKKCLYSGVFPRNKDFQYPASLVIEKLKTNEHHQVFVFLKEFVNEVATRKLPKDYFLKCCATLPN